MVHLPIRNNLFAKEKTESGNMSCRNWANTGIRLAKYGKNMGEIKSLDFGEIIDMATLLPKFLCTGGKIGFNPNSLLECLLESRS